MYKFLIYISHPYSIPIGKPLQRELQRRNHPVCWFSDQEYTKKYFEGEETVLHSVEEVMAFGAHVVLTASDHVADFFPGIKVQIFHGFSANKRAFSRDHFRIRGFFDLYTTQGPSTTSVFQQLAAKHQYFEVEETGWSKVDPLFPLEEQVKYPIPTVLIASTFTTRLSMALKEEVFEEVRRLATEGNYRFLCVLHPKLPQHTKDKFARLNGEYFQYFDTTDLVPLFKQADIMLSDTTSAITEFLLQRKAVVTFNNRVPGSELINVTEVSEIESALKEALNPPDTLLEAIDQFILMTHPYTDGQSSGRIIDAAIRFLEKDKTHLKKKPLNLVRKWKVRKLLKYFTLKTDRTPLTINPHHEQ